MKEEYYITEQDGEEFLIHSTPMNQYGEDVCKIETVISKEAFIKCYERWIKQANEK